MRMVASMGMPTCKGAEDAKKKPPRETFRASVKCSVLSAATPTARKRRGVRCATRASCRRSVAFITTSYARARVGTRARQNGRLIQAYQRDRRGQVPKIGWVRDTSTFRKQAPQRASDLAWPANPLYKFKWI